MRRLYTSTSSGSSAAATASLLLLSHRTMRLGNNQHRKAPPRVAPLAPINQPVQLDEDYTPFPLPRYDPVNELEPSFVRGSIDGERVLQTKRQLTSCGRGQQQHQQQHLFIEAEPMQDSAVQDIVDALEQQHASATTTTQKKLQEDQHQSSGVSVPYFHRFGVSRRDQYIREPNDAQIDRLMCLRTIPQLVVEQLTADSPNMERNVSALADISNILSDYMDAERRQQQQQHEQTELQQSAGDEQLDQEILSKIQQHQLATKANIMHDFAFACSGLMSMFEGASRSLFLAVFENMAIDTIAYKQSHPTQDKFFNFFYQAERFVCEVAIPRLMALSSLQQNQEGEREQCLNAITEYLRIVAHFQTLDHRRHFDRNEIETSGRLRPTHAAAVWGHLRDATGNRCFEALTEMFADLGFGQQQQQRHQQQQKEDDVIKKMIIIPTATLAQWLVSFGTSFERVLSDSKTHPEFRERIVEELVLCRLLPACKAASAVRIERPFALFEDINNNESENEVAPPLLLGEASGSRRAAVIGDILMGCALCDVTLPADFLEQGLIDTALQFARAKSVNKAPAVATLPPNFFASIAKLMGSLIPHEKLFELARIEYSLFCKQQGEHQQEQPNPLEHDWINAIYDIAFATHNRVAAIEFLQHPDVNLGARILHRVSRFARDTAGDATENVHEVNTALPAEVSSPRLTSHLAPAVDSSSELFQSRGVSDPIDVDEPDSVTQPLSNAEIARFPTLLGSSSSSAFSSAAGSFTSTTAFEKIATSRNVYILHHSLLRGPSLDTLRAIIEECREQSACLVVPASCLYHLAETTADTASLCGRRPFLAIKRRAIRAIIEELRLNTKTVFVTPEEEVAIRFHEGWSTGDTLVWELSSWIQTRAPTSKVIISCDDNSRVRYRHAVFDRRLSLTADARMEGQPLPSQQQEQHAQEHYQKSTSSVQLLLRRASATSTAVEGSVVDYDDAESHMVRLPPGRTNSNHIDRHVGTLLQRWTDTTWHRHRVRDPIENKKFQPGLWSAGNRAQYRVQARKNWENGLDADSTAMGKSKTRRLAGHSHGSSMEDLRYLGVYTPDHGN